MNRDAWLNPDDAMLGEFSKRVLTALYDKRPSWLAALTARWMTPPSPPMDPSLGASHCVIFLIKFRPILEGHRDLKLLLPKHYQALRIARI